MSDHYIFVVLKGTSILEQLQVIKKPQNIDLEELEKNYFAYTFDSKWQEGRYKAMGYDTYGELKNENGMNTIAYIDNRNVQYF